MQARHTYAVKEPDPIDYTDPRRRRLMLAFESMSSPQIDAMLKEAELTVQTNRKIVAALDGKKSKPA